jgi:hypothetical protein
MQVRAHAPLPVVRVHEVVVEIGVTCKSQVEEHRGQAARSQLPGRGDTVAQLVVGVNADADTARGFSQPSPGFLDACADALVVPPRLL